MKRFLVLILVMSMIIPTVIFAAESPFKTVNTYTENLFSDISEDDWFYESVAGAYSYGFTAGSGDGRYTPYGLVSVAEVITFADRLNMLYNGKNYSVEDSEKWYTPWVEYAEKNAIINPGEFSGRYEKAATRAQVAYILGNSIPFNEFENINTHISGVPDMANTDEFYNEVIMLYRAGVLTGKDSKGNFAPTENITRAEIAAVLYRIADESARVRVDFIPDENVPGQNGNEIYNAEQISEIAANSVFLIGVYNEKNEIFASGSGFFIGSDGTAVTNYHVIEDAASAHILTADGNSYEVEKVLGFDAEGDIAVIKVKGGGFAAAKVGDSDVIRNGQEIFCIGSPQGLDNTISEGLVSNVSREIDGRKYIQISAPISQGSSGGAVFNNKAEVIGITSAGITSGQNLNLAIPINDVFAVELNVNKTLAELFGKNQDISHGMAPSGVFYDGTTLPTYTYITGRNCLSTEVDEDITIYTYNFSQMEFMLYLSVLGSLGWKAVEYEEDGTLTMISTMSPSRNEVVIVGYDIAENIVFVAY